MAWVQQKSISVQVPYNLVAVRAFYLADKIDIFCTLARDFHLDAELETALALDLAFPTRLNPELALTLDRNLALEIYLSVALSLPNVRSHAFHLALDLAHDIDSRLEQALQELKERLPTLAPDKKIFKQWCEEADGRAWTKKLRAVMIKHRNIGHHWQFSNEQKELLEQYYYANKLLVKCLNSDCYVSREVRQGIEDTLLLPIAEIEQREE